MNAGKAISENHPDEILLIAYLESPRLSEFRNVRMHLITCPVCRREVAALQMTIEALRHHPTVIMEELSGDHPDEVTIADYVEKSMPQERRAEVKQHLLACNYCTRATLHYALEIAQTEREGLGATESSPLKPDLQEAERGAGRLGKLAGILSWRMPVWIGVPATALAVLTLFLIFSGKESRLTVVSYQDKAEVVFSSPKGDIPGIGFFGGAREKAEPFGGLTIHPEDAQHLRLKWSEIETARLYEIRIYSSNGDGRTLIGEAGTSGSTEVLLRVSGVVPGKRYEWELSGTAANDLRFLARGGFVVGMEVRF